MRVIHTSDWHLGQELHAFDRAAEHDAFLAWLLARVRALDADALLVTGDIYDSANPPVSAQDRLYRFIRNLLGISDRLQVVLIGGNHDSAARLELPRALLDEHRVHLIGALPRADNHSDIAHTVRTLHDRRQKPAVTCIAMPFLRNSDLPAEQVSGGIRAVYGEAVQHAQLSQLPIIAMGHLNLRGGDVSEESERRIYIGGEEAIPSDVFTAEITYVALGHLHKPQAVNGATTIRYAGSPFPLSSTERDYEHSIVVADLDSGGNVTVDLQRIPRHVEFLRVPREGALAVDAAERQLRELVVGDISDDRRPFMEVEVQLFGPEPQLQQRIRDALASKPVRLINIVRRRLPTGDMVIDSAEQASDAIADPSEVFRRLHLKRFATEPDAELQSLFREVLAAAGAEAEQ